MCGSQESGDKEKVKEFVFIFRYLIRNQVVGRHSAARVGSYFIL